MAVMKSKVRYQVLLPSPYCWTQAYEPVEKKRDGSLSYLRNGRRYIARPGKWRTRCDNFTFLHECDCGKCTDDNAKG